MPCSTCGTENPPEAKFCLNCGTDLRITCPNCSSVNPPAAQFCMNCGNRLAGKPATEAQEAPRPAPIQPAPPIPALVQAKTESESERRVVTILFVDVKGSTSLAEQVDPEEWTEIIDGAFRRLIPAVTRYGGTVARLMGDALLALFGAPVAHEDDPYRAILTSLDILAGHGEYRATALERLRRRGARPEEDDFQVRIGISTGLVVVGTVGSAEKQEYTAMGDAINVAARMEQSAAPGTIQISHETYRLIDEQIEAEPLGELAIKGKSRPVRVYRVTGLRRQTGLARSVSGFASPLIGREKELELIEGKLDRLALGTGQILCLIGEAGLGKSRLLAEVKATAGARQLLWIEAASLSYETDHPYGLFRQLLRSVCGCMPDDPPETVRQQIAARLDGRPEEEIHSVSRAMDILFSQGAVEDDASVSPQDRQDQLYEGAEVIWRVQAGQRPLALVLEDLHWADAASIGLIRHLFTLTNRAAICFICVFRPSRRSPAWGLKQAAEQEYPHRYAEIELSPLSNEDSNRLVSNLLESSELPARVVRLVLDKAEGNPFFVEEIVGELIESGSVVPGENGGGWLLAVPIEEIDLPESLEALIVARLDRLEENARQTLQMAAVIGRSFNFRVLKMISEGIDRIEDHLSALERSGIILEARRSPELEYMFRHVLTQEAAYNTMLLKRRRVFHQRTGEVMESLFADRLDEQAALLAFHFHRAGNAPRALRYETIAAENAARLHANFEAVAHYDKALDIAGGFAGSDLEAPGGEFLEDGGAAAMAASRIRLLRGRASIYEILGMFPQALADLEAALEAARSSGSKRDDWQILLELGQLWASRDYAQVGQYFEQALAIAREIDEPSLLAASLNRVGNWHANQERPHEGIRYHLEALALLEQIGDERGLADTNDLLGMASLIGGNLADGQRYYERAIELFERLDERFGLISALTTLAYRGPTTRNSYVVTDLSTALRYGERALDLTREIGWRAGEAYACFSLCSLLASMGTFDRGLALGELALEIATEIQHHQWMAAARISLGSAYADLLAWETAEPHLAEGLRLGVEVGSRNWQYSAAAWLAYCYLEGGKVQKAKESLEEIGRLDPPLTSISSRNYWVVAAQLANREGRPRDALEICDRLTAAGGWPAEAVVPLLHKIRAASLASLRETGQAIALAQAALDRCEALGERSLAWGLAADLGRYRRSAGDENGAAAAFETARGMIEGIAGTIGDGDLRGLFLRRALEKIEE